jgi:tetratricopeptide (TPR) repeat protein
MRRTAIFTAVLLAVAIAAFPQAKQLKPKSPKEGAAIKAMLEAADPNARIKAADDLITKFADTDFKAFALYLEADSYAQLGNSEKAIVYGEQTLEADPKNYQAQVLLAKMYVQTTKPTDLDKEEKLKKASKYANEALETLKTAEKPNPQLTDPQWTEMKNDFIGQAYLAIGVDAAFHNKMDDVTAAFTKVAELDSDPSDLVRAGRVLIDLKKYAAAIPWFEKAAAFPGVNPQIKQIAESDKARAQAMVK